MESPNEHLHDYAPQMAEALTDIAKALGITDADFYNQPEKARNFAWDAADRIQTLIEATNADPTTDVTPVTAPGPRSTPAVDNTPDLDDPAVVAVLRLPIAVSHLLPISDLMEKVYGPGLMTPSPGRFFVLRRPDTDTPAATNADGAILEETTDAPA